MKSTTIIDPNDYEDIIKNYPSKSRSLKLEFSPSLAFDILYHCVNTPRSYCIKLEENIDAGSENFAAEALITLSTASAEQILLQLKGNHLGEVSLKVWSYDEQIIDKFLTAAENRLKVLVEDLKNCDDQRLEDLRSGIIILKELDRVYYYSLTGEVYRRIYFMLADSRERLYKILIKGTYGSFNPAIIEMQTYLGMLLRHNQDTVIEEGGDSMRVGLATLKWKRWIIILIQRILHSEEE